tara:strand:+ start:7570 stop:7800 length:231 start_codon:yes stop_codon:yes gene_type:complete
MWTIEKIEDVGFKLITNEKKWCHFRGFGFDVFINLDTKVVKGNYFNFKSYKSNFRGNFKAVLNTKEEFEFLLKVIQ